MKLNARTSAGLVLLSIGIKGQVFAQCDDWHAGPLFNIAGTNDTAMAAIAWDPDGSGPLNKQLVIGGYFSQAGATLVNGIARWDGTTWRGFAGGINASSSLAGVFALAVLPASFGAQAGHLIAAGNFDHAGGVAANSIARWDGTAWHPLGAGLRFADISPANARALFAMPAGSGALSNHLIAAGDFQLAGGVTVNGVADWDGTSWHSLGGGFDFTYYTVVAALTAWDPDGAGPLPAQLVAASDISIQLSNYGTGTTAAQGDLNGDHAVNLADLALMLSTYGSACP